jgi:hypothetical protein
METYQNLHLHLANMPLGHLLTHSAVERLKVSLMISPGFSCDIKIDIKNKLKELRLDRSESRWQAASSFLWGTWP